MEAFKLIQNMSIEEYSEFRNQFTFLAPLEGYSYWLELYVKTGELSHLNNMLEKVETYGSF
jgi:hypothetical protein